MTFNRHLHNKYDRYFNSFIGCELLNLGIAIFQVIPKCLKNNPSYAQFFLTDRFLGHTFLTYGPDVYRYYRWCQKSKTLISQLSARGEQARRAVQPDV